MFREDSHIVLHEGPSYDKLFLIAFYGRIREVVVSRWYFLFVRRVFLFGCFVCWIFPIGGDSPSLHHHYSAIPYAIDWWQISRAIANYTVETGCSSVSLMMHSALPPSVQRVYTGWAGWLCGCREIETICSVLSLMFLLRLEIVCLDFFATFSFTLLLGF